MTWFVVLLFGGCLFIAASLIPIKGAYVLNSALYGDPAYRDVRGIPFIFLKRSLGDGECDINDVKIGICDPKARE